MSMDGHHGLIEAVASRTRIPTCTDSEPNQYGTTRFLGMMVLYQTNRCHISLPRQNPLYSNRRTTHSPSSSSDRLEAWQLGSLAAWTLLVEQHTSIFVPFQHSIHPPFHNDHDNGNNHNLPTSSSLIYRLHCNHLQFTESTSYHQRQSIPTHSFHVSGISFA